MKRKRTQIYINSNLQTNEITYSGIEFSEFVKYLADQIENLMIINGGCNVISLETEFDRCFELFEGNIMVQKLAHKNIYNLGDFCFVDYSSSKKLQN